MKCTNCGYLSGSTFECELCGEKFKDRKKPKKELDFYKAIWSVRPHFCEVSGKPIQEFDVRCFSHVLTKGAYPSLRLYEKNIVLCLPYWHEVWEFGDRSCKELEWVVLLEQNLKREFYDGQRF